VYSSPAPVVNYNTENTNNNNAAVTADKEKDKEKQSSAHTYTSLVINMLQSKYASMMNVLPQAVTNLNLYSFIEDWYGVKYLWGGTTKDGIDCSAFVQKVYEQVFHTEIVRTSLQQFQMSNFTKKIDDLKEGDLVFFKTKGKKRAVSHVGVYLKNNYFVHAASSTGVSISSLNDAYWNKVYAGAGRVL
jgi:lipoprotein Spr